MRNALLAVALIAFAGTLAASAAVPAAPVPTEPSEDEAPFVAPEPAAMCSDDLATPRDGAALFQAVPVPCTNGSPTCRKDRDCATFCGDPQFGVCRDRCCVCTG